MAVTLEIIPAPIGSQYTQSIGTDDHESLNDFTVRILASENGTGLEESDITLSTGASLVELTGDGVTREAVIRPPETEGTLTLTIAANAFSEGNAETSKDIRISTSFPDTDAEVPTALFTASGTAITVSSTRIYLGTGRIINAYTYDGVEQVAERITLFVPGGGTFTFGRMDFFNNTFLATQGNRSFYRYLSDGSRGTLYSAPGNSVRSMIAHTPFGILAINSGQTGSSNFYLFLYDDDTPIEIDNTIGYAHIRNHGFLAAQNNLFWTNTGLLKLTANNEIERVGRLNFQVPTNPGDLAIYGDTIYMVRSGEVQTLDIRPYRPMSVNTKTRIDVQFIGEGGSLDTKRLCPDAEKVIFSTGFDKPTWLSIDSDTGVISVASSAVTETTPVLVRLTGINYIDSADFSFYLIIVPASSPTWRDVESLSMKANTTYNLHQIVDADSIAFESGETQPTGSSMSNGVFTIVTTAGTAYFRATKGGLTTDKAIQIDVIQAPNPDNFSDITRYKIEIAGIDVTSDYNRDSPLRLTKSLDDVELSRYRAHSVTVSLRDTDGEYSPDLAGNFWETNNLNPGGYQEKIKVYRESYHQ